jgi:hypothetical protein
MMAVSIAEAVIYLVLSLVCWFYFFHHPAHIGISAGATVYSLNTDQTHLQFTPQNAEASQLIR